MNSMTEVSWPSIRLIYVNFCSHFSYVGQFFEDLPHGLGQYLWSAGHRYTGSYRLGAPHGQGVFITSVGDTYEGDFANGLPNGRGEFRYGETYASIGLR